MNDSPICNLNGSNDRVGEGEKRKKAIVLEWREVDDIHRYSRSKGEKSRGRSEHGGQ